jgi:hypothetical protein
VGCFAGGGLKLFCLDFIGMVRFGSWLVPYLVVILLYLFLGGLQCVVTPFLCAPFFYWGMTGSPKRVKKMMFLCSLREGQVLGEMPQAFRGERFSYASHSL